MVNGLSSHKVEWLPDIDRLSGRMVLCVLLLVGYAGDLVYAADSFAFPEKFVFRIAAYHVKDADADLTVLSDDFVGTGFSFVDDLGGDDDLTVPRIDISYRVSDFHRLEFTTFRIERDGKKKLTIDIDIGDESYSVGETVVSSIDYELFKLGYAYSLYRSPEAEISFTIGLNFTEYTFEYQLVDGSSDDSSEASGPLPMFGARVGYAFDARWSIHLLTEVLFIEIGDAEGSIQNYELDLQYRLNDSLILGMGLARFSIDVTSEEDDWNGRIADTHPGFVLFGSYYIE